MPRAVSVIAVYQFQNSFDSEQAKKTPEFNKGDNKMGKLVSRDRLYCFPPLFSCVHGSKAE